MTPPFSPSTSYPPEIPNPLSSSPRRILRSLVVQAKATPSGIQTTLYCKVNLSSSSSTLLDLLPTSKVTRYEAYNLPIDGENAPEEQRRAAQVLGIATEEKDPQVNGRGSLASHDERNNKNVEVIQEGNKLVLRREGEDGDYSEDNSAISDRSQVTVNGRAGSVSPEDSRGRDTVELIVVIEMETSFGRLCEPKFANTITISTPPCLRNVLHLTLPPPPSATTSWDLKVAPSLSNVQSCSLSPSIDSSPSTLLTGSFPSASSLLIRWNRQLPPSSAAPSLIIPSTSLDVRWSINELGWGRSELNVKGSFEYSGLKDKHWIELEVGLGEDDEASKGVFEVLECEGEGVLGWEIERDNGGERLFSPRLESLDEFSSPLDDSLIGMKGTPSQPQTPTPRRRYSTITPRPPSWTSLFDTAPPAPPDLDSSLIVNDLPKGKEPSLLRTTAPFDEEGSGMDMSFEAGGGGESEIENQTEPEEAEDDQSSSTSSKTEKLPPRYPRRQEPAVIRIQLSLSPLLHPRSEDDPPEFALRIILDFPAVTLRALSSPSSIRLALPSFSIPAAKEEESIVSVAASSLESDKGSNVEIVNSELQDLFVSTSPPSSNGGSARWSTLRGIEDLEKNGSTRGRVQVSVALPFTSVTKPEEPVTATQPVINETSALLQPGDVGPRRVRPKRERKRSNSALNLVPSSSSTSPPSTLPLVKIQITPISPTFSLPSPSPSEWRIFYRLLLPSSSINSFILPLPSDSKLRVHDAWGIDGQSVKWTSDNVRNGKDGEEKGLRISSVEALREVLWEERKSGEEVEGAAVLPFLENRVGKYEVEVLEAQGYDLHVVIHDFDSSNRSKGSSSSIFTKFLVLPDTRPFLPLRFKPSWATPRPSTPTQKQLSARPRMQSRTSRILPYLPLLFFLLILPYIFSPLSNQSNSDPLTPQSIRQTPIVSYSTITQTQTQTVVSITTHVSTITQTHLQIPSLTPLATPTTSISTPLAPPTPVQTIPINFAEYSISNETGNVVLVWLERLKANTRLYFEGLLRWLRTVA